MLKLAIALLIATSAVAAPQWPTLDPYLPDQSGILVVINVDRDAKEVLSGLLPLDPAIVKKVLDEHLGAFAAGSGIQVADLAHVFGAIGTAGAGAGVVAVQVPVDLAKVTKAIKATPGASVLEYPGQVFLTKGGGCWAFLKEGFILIGKTEAVQAILKRKGGSPSNAAFVTAAKARGATSTNLFLTAAIPAGAVPPLPENPLTEKIALDRQLTTHLTGITLSSNESGLGVALEFDDAQWTTKLATSWTKGFAAWNEKLKADLAAAETKAANLGLLGTFHPELVSGKMSVESAAYLEKSLTTKTDGKSFTISVPRDLLKAMKGGGTIATLGIAAAMVVPAMKSAQK